jgi:signal transduction histidine kinase
LLVALGRMNNQLSTNFSAIIPVILAESPTGFKSAHVHEIRNPLTNIKLATELLEPSLGENNQQRRYLDIIRRNAERINVLIDGLLIDKHTNKKQSQKYSVLKLLDEVIEEVKDRILLKNIRIKKRYSPDCAIALNEADIRIALTNIIINAIEAMPPDKGELELITRMARDKFIMMIKDNGHGINKQNLKKIFTPFFTGKPGGLGVGLAATSDILWANHILVNVKSKEGQGTCFILLFQKPGQDRKEEAEVMEKPARGW